MFAGREYDSETGLYYNRARYYSPSIGRFLQRDPVGYSAGINLYSYCSNNSINFTDPSGLDKWSLSQFGKGVGTALLAIGIGTGVVLVLPEAILASAVGTSLLWTLGIIGSAGLGLNTGAVITGQTISGHSLSASERSYLAGNALVGWGTLGVGAAITKATSNSDSTIGVYRRGTFAGESSIKGPQWATENPATTPDYAAKYGLPADNTGKPDWIIKGHLQEGSYTSGPAAASYNAPGNTGGASEIIPNNPNNVVLDWFHMPD